ncbi:MAG: SagB/ThcOx family dehydrogenase [Peptococcaceae bacterium]|nr:SagB/ThcOx family dehydrogenase [Peptococcaceae bacterium]
MERFRSVIGREFMENTKYQYAKESDQMKELPQPPLERAAPIGLKRIPLAPVNKATLGKIDLLAAIEARYSLRKYSEAPLTLEELGFLLWTTQGVKKVTSRPATLRTVPSAGARHCFETYLLVNRVVGLSPGLYLYRAIEHELVLWAEGSQYGAELSEACLQQPFVGTSAVTFFWAADAYRMEWRYGERGYRYLHLDAGHVCQNLYLAATALQAGVCAIAAFNDDAVNKIFNLDGENDFVVYIATVGRP